MGKILFLRVGDALEPGVPFPLLCALFWGSFWGLSCCSPLRQGLAHTTSCPHWAKSHCQIWDPPLNTVLRSSHSILTNLLPIYLPSQWVSWWAPPMSCPPMDHLRIFLLFSSSSQALITFHSTRHTPAQSHTMQSSQTGGTFNGRDVVLGLCTGSSFHALGQWAPEGKHWSLEASWVQVFMRGGGEYFLVCSRENEVWGNAENPTCWLQKPV